MMRKVVNSQHGFLVSPTDYLSLLTTSCTVDCSRHRALFQDYGQIHTRAAYPSPPGAFLSCAKSPLRGRLSCSTNRGRSDGAGVATTCAPPSIPPDNPWPCGTNPKRKPRGAGSKHATFGSRRQVLISYPHGVIKVHDVVSNGPVRFRAKKGARCREQ